MATVFLMLILLLFPLVCYFVYLFYNKAIFENENNLFLDLSLLTGFYLCNRFSNVTIYTVFLINIPILISFYKKRNISGIILSICCVLILYKLYSINIIFWILLYMIITLLNIFSNFKKVNIFIISNVIFQIITFLIYKINSFETLISNLFMIFMVYIISYFVMVLYSKIELSVKMYRSLKDITHEKKLYESLFKITHEIKNPLAVCKGYLDMFDIKNTSKANKYIYIINEEIDRTLGLLKDFSNVSKINIKKEKMDINILIDDVCDEARMIFKNKVKFKYFFEDNVIYINGDYDRLKQVLINVIKNAKEAIQDDGKVNLQAKRLNNKFVITLIDNGVGMNKETLKKIGTAFYTTKKNGTGLGVCFSKEIIEKHGGSIEYISKAGKGTIVKIILPILKDN